MSSQRSKRGATWGVFSRLFQPLDGRAWPTAAGIFFVCVIGLTTYHLWRQYGDRVMAQPRYQLDPSRMQVTSQPEYIRSDVIESAIVHGQLRNANLLEKDLVLQVKQAFAVQPWVKQVLRVNKQYPSTVEIDVEYRRPVAMVEVPAGTFQSYDYEGLLPIDDEAYLLPVEMTQDEANQLPKVAGIDSSPAGPPGSPWGDMRVAEAVEIIALLEEVWQQLDLRKIEVPTARRLGNAGTLGESSSGQFVLVTRLQNRFAWGAAPGKESPGEVTAEQKALELKAFAEQIGWTLDEWHEKKHQTGQPSVSALIEWQKRL